MGRTPFATQLKVSRAEKGADAPVAHPGWRQVEEALAAFDEGEVGCVELSNADESTMMTIFGQAGCYHIGISAMESEYHYYWNGSEPGEKLVDVAWNVFPGHQICRDTTTLRRIARTFFETGRRLDDVRWISEDLED